MSNDEKNVQKIRKVADALVDTARERVPCQRVQALRPAINRLDAAATSLTKG